MQPKKLTISEKTAYRKSSKITQILLKSRNINLMANKRVSKMSHEKEEIPNIFSSMFSLLKRTPSEHEFRPSFLLPDIFSPSKGQEEVSGEERKGRKCKKVTACPHFNKQHYAKNMCSNCYHKTGRTKHAWACSHPERQMYAKGMCQQCYLQQYNDSKHYFRLRSRERQED